MSIDDLALHTFLGNGNGSPIGGEWERLRGEEKDTVTMAPP